MAANSPFVNRCWRLCGSLLIVVVMMPCVSVAQLGGDFSLTNHRGDRFQFSELRGKTVLMAFGFTHCPDVCPLELSTIAQVLKQVKNEHSNDNAVVGVFVTLDPERDTADTLARFLPFFHEDIVGLTGTQAQIRTVADQYGIRYSRHGENDEYTIDHATGVHVIDAKGELASIAPFGATAGHLLRVLEQIESSK